MVPSRSRKAAGRGVHLDSDQALTDDVERVGVVALQEEHVPFLELHVGRAARDLGQVFGFHFAAMA